MSPHPGAAQDRRRATVVRARGERRYASAMATAPPLQGVEPPDPGEVRILIHGVTWDQYEQLVQMFDDRAGPRISYLEGTLEIMSPGSLHEDKKTLIARLLELYALVRGIRFYGLGSTTYRQRARERGLEPDECYFIGSRDDDFPHLAIEVALTSGGIDKLAIYAGLGVREVWFWHGDRLTLHRLEGDAYVEIDRSHVLPDLDLDELVAHVKMDDQDAAVRAWWAKLSS